MEDLRTGFTNLFENEVSEIRQALFGTLNPQNEEIKLSEIPAEHKTLARLVGQTYDNKREDFGGYQYQKSLLLGSFLAPSVVAGVGGLKTEQILKELTKSVAERRSGLLRELGGREALSASFNALNPLQYLIGHTREHRYAGMAQDYLTEEESGVVGGITLPPEPYYQFFYVPNIPNGLIGILAFASTYQYAINNMKVEEQGQDLFLSKSKNERSINVPRINFYHNGNEDVFTIRGTMNIDDIGNDVVLGVEEKTGITGGALYKKLSHYEDFIMNNKREGTKVVVAGHSLGSLEMSLLHDSLERKGIKIRGVGFSHPVLPPKKSDDLTYYSFKYDPLYEPSDVPNHYFIDKPKTGKTLSERFNNFHALTNYY